MFWQIRVKGILVYVFPTTKNTIFAGLSKMCRILTTQSLKIAQGYSNDDHMRHEYILWK